jgi:hypothetical protein
MIAKELKHDPEYSNDRYYNNLVFLYDINSPGTNPVVYSSVNKALKSSSIYHGTLMDYVINQYIFRNNFVLSFEPLSPENLIAYCNKPEGDNQLRNHVILFNEENEPVFEFKSGREMSRHFNIDGKVARAAIAIGVYQNFTIVSKPVSFRKKVFVFNSESFKLITELNSITDAMKYAKVNFYTLKVLLETNKPHDGKIYSYNITPKPK